MSVSVIIPTLNEEGCLAETLHQLREQRPHQVIVVDGGSQDATCQKAKDTDVLLHCSPGRAIQMNRGADRATGDILLFLHADCVLESGALEEAEELLRRRSIVAGCFRMSVRASGWRYRAIDYCATARVRLLGLPYGDQGLFLYKDNFQRLGGFPPVRLMEDLYFGRQMRHQGRIVLASRRIFVSPRRWERTGLVRQTLRNWTLTALAAVGVHPDWLETYYPAVR